MIALVPKDAAGQVEQAVTGAFLAAGHAVPNVFTTTAAAGARRLA